MITDCEHCGADHGSVAAARLCCIFAPLEKNGWCAWCGEDSARTFCSRACALSYARDRFAESSEHRPRGWCLWCGKDCEGRFFCGPKCARAFDRDLGSGTAQKQSVL